MISVSLPPVFYGASLTTGEYFEAFAMAYWASYSTEAIQPRVNQSMRNSWGVVDGTMFPRTNGVKPGVCVARIGAGTDFRLVVGIEGLASPSQVLSANTLAPVGVSGLSGSVVNMFAVSNEAIRTAVAANAIVNGWMTNPRIPITFAGFSQGAAIAELWACKMKRDFPNRQVKFVKFASPRVGTSRWRNNRNPAIKWGNVYTETDPISNIPVENDTCIVPGSINVNIMQLIAHYVREQSCYRLRTNGSMFATHFDLWYATAMYYVSQYSRPMVPANPWYQHQLDFYRLAMCAWANVQPDELRYRFTFMEFNNENQWGLVYRPGMDGLVPGLTALLDPQPDPVTPLTAADARNAIVDPVAPERGQADPINNDDDAVRGGDWGITEPVLQSTYRPQRRVRIIQR